MPRDREGTFTTEVFEEYHWSTGEVEDAVLEMWLQGISQRAKVARSNFAREDSGCHAEAGGGQDRQGCRQPYRGAAGLGTCESPPEGTLRVSAFRNRRLEMAYPYLYLDATYLKVNWGSHVGDVALLVVIGVNAQGFREVLAVESAAGEKKEAYRNLLKGLIERGLTGVQLVVSDDHESIKAAVQVELPSARWQRCIVHFERNVLCHVPASDMEEVASDLKGIFAVHRRESAGALAEAFVERYGKRFVKAVGVLKNGLANALTFLSFPSGHHRLLRTTNGSAHLQTAWSVSSGKSSDGRG